MGTLEDNNNTKEEESYVVLDDDGEETSSSKKAIDKKILFPLTALKNGYTKEQWESTQSTRQIIHTSPILLQQKTAQTLFSSWWGGTSSPPANYELRILLLYASPNIIVILRHPINIHELKNCYFSYEEYKQLIDSNIDDYYIIE